MRVLILVLLVLVAAALAKRPCTEADQRGFYLSCVDGKRDMLWYWDDQECEVGGQQTKPRVNGLPCDIQCSAGQFLPYGGDSCEICQPGTFSMGGGARFTHFDKWPQETGVMFRSWCARPAGYVPSADDPAICDGWQLNGYNINSGDLTHYNHIYSDLVVSFVLKHSGYVKFRYRSETESINGGLWIQVDNKPAEHLPDSAEYRTVVRYYDRGIHFMAFVFWKDETSERANDIAAIDEIEIGGLSDADDYCTPCTPGYHASKAEMARCEPCDFNTIAAGHGNAECADCGQTMYALRGRGECLRRTENCTEDDIEITYSPCHQNDTGSWIRSRTATWAQPSFCLPNFTLPEPELNATCASCNPGYFKPDNDHDCEACPIGQYADGNHHCKQCDSGSAAVPDVYFTEWDVWAPNFTTGCDGADCVTGGWLLYSDHIHTGNRIGNRVDVWLQIRANVMEFGGAIEFTVMVAGKSTSSYLQVLVDGYYRGMFVSKKSPKYQTESIPLSGGDHLIVFNFHHNDEGGNDPDAKASINKIVLRGVAGGGADACDKCPAGYYQPEENTQQCLMCGPGTFSDEEASECTPCAGNTFAASAGATKCDTCAKQTKANARHTDCVTSCKFTSSEGVVYNLATLSSLGTQIIRDPVRNDTHYLVSLCNRLPQKDCEDEPFICEVTPDPNERAKKVLQLDQGHYIGFLDTDDADKYDFALRYTDGDTGYGCDSTRSTTVRFKCNQELAENVGVRPTVVRELSSECDMVFLFEGPYACRECVQKDYQRDHQGDCDDGHREVTLKLISDDCLGPDTQQVQESCADVQLNLPVVIVIVAVVIGAIGILLGALFVIYRRKQEMEYKYSVLKGATSEEGGMHIEMADVDNQIGDDDEKP